MKQLLTKRLYCSILVTLLVFVVSGVYRVLAPEPVNDLYFPFCGAQAVIDGENPYDGRCIITYRDRVYPPNPMTTILAAVPFLPFGGIAPLTLWSCMTGLLVYSILKTDQSWKFLALLSAPYLDAFLTLQWSPLILAITLLPALLPLALIKPQTGLPVILTHLTRRRVVGCAVFLALTLIVLPHWPLDWLPQTTSYDGYIPLLAPFGLLLLLTLVQWRDSRAQFLLLMAFVPQRGVYDLLTLWSLPTTKRQMIMLTALSWIMYGLWRLGGLASLPALSVVFMYLPLLALIVLRERFRKVA